MDYRTYTRSGHWLTREVFNAVYADRQRTDNQDPLEPPGEALAHGDSLAVFPEGTRRSLDEPMLFKRGLYRLAGQFPDVALIPVWIDNAQHVTRKRRVLPVAILCTAPFVTPMRMEAGEQERAHLDRARRAVLAARPMAA